MTAATASTTKTIIIPLFNTQQVINLKQMKPYLIGQGVFSFVDGSTVCPSPHNDISANETTNNSGFSQAFLAWKQQDQLILSALLSFLSINVLHLMVDCPTSTSVWSTLEHALPSPSNSQIMQLHGCLKDLCQGDDSVTTYQQKAKGSLMNSLPQVAPSPSRTSIYMSCRVSVVTFVILLPVYLQKLTLYRILSSIATYPRMNFYVRALSNIVPQLHRYCQRLHNPLLPLLSSRPFQELMAMVLPSSEVEEDVMVGKHAPLLCSIRWQQFQRRNQRA